MDVYARRRERLAELLREISAAELAELSGVAPSLITRYLYEPGKNGAKNLGEMNARKLEGAAGKVPGWLDRVHSSAGVAPPRQAQKLSPPLLHDAFTTAAAVPVRFHGRPTAQGELVLELLEAGGHVAAPSVGPRAYAIRISGDGLHPVVRHGSVLICDPDTAPETGDLVVLHMPGGRAALRELMAQRADAVMTSAVLGGGRETTPLADIERVDAVVLLAIGSRWRQE